MADIRWISYPTDTDFWQKTGEKVPVWSNRACIKGKLFKKYFFRINFEDAVTSANVVLE